MTHQQALLAFWNWLRVNQTAHHAQFVFTLNDGTATPEHHEGRKPEDLDPRTTTDDEKITKFLEELVP